VSDINIHEIADCTCGRLRRATRRITQLYDHALLPVDLTVSQFGLLAHLYGAKMLRAGGLSLTVLADHLGMDPSTLTRNLKPLERRGLVADRSDPNDKRARLVTITDSGCSKLGEALPYWRRAQNQVKQALGAAAVKDLRGLLDAAFTNVSL
jgi:DNA-binding MarR family transcriptional regulator